MQSWIAKTIKSTILCAKKDSRPKSAILTKYKNTTNEIVEKVKYFQQKNIYSYIYYSTKCCI